MKETKDAKRLRAICTAGVITDEDKDFLREMSEREGLDYTPCETCPNWYADRAAVLYDRIKTSDKTKAGCVLKDGTDVIFGGVRVNNAVMTPRLAAWLKKRNFPAYYYAD